LSKARGSKHGETPAASFSLNHGFFRMESGFLRRGRLWRELEEEFACCKADHFAFVVVDGFCLPSSALKSSIEERSTPKAQLNSCSKVTVIASF